MIELILCGLFMFMVGVITGVWIVGGNNLDAEIQRNRQRIDDIFKGRI